MLFLQVTAISNIEKYKADITNRLFDNAINWIRILCLLINEASYRHVIMTIDSVGSVISRIILLLLQVTTSKIISINTGSFLPHFLSIYKGL